MLVIGLEGTQAYGRALAAQLRHSDCVLLKGDLGAGKTTLAESIVRALYGGDIAVISPSFNLLQTYDVTLHGAPVVLWHYDLYRLELPEELAELGLEEALERGITLIEWPEIAEPLLPESRIEIAIEFTESNENRNILLFANEQRLTALREAGLC